MKSLSKNNEPLKRKTQVFDFENPPKTVKVYEQADVCSAVDWLKGRIISELEDEDAEVFIGWVNEAFSDVVEKETKE